MALEKTSVKNPERPIWPLWIGYSISAVWLTAFAIYGFFVWQDILQLAPNNLGDFLAGLFAPLAFLWLFVATLLQKAELIAQREELVLNREVLSLQAEELHNSVAQLKTQAEILDKQYKSQARQQALLDIRNGISGICSVIIEQFSGDGTLSTRGGIFEIPSFLYQTRLREMLAVGNHTFLIEEINRRLSASLTSIGKNLDLGHKVIVKKKPTVEVTETVLLHIDQILRIPDVFGAPELSEKFEFEFPILRTRENVSAIRDFLTLPKSN